MIYFTAMVMIKACAPPWLLAYCKCIGLCATRFGQRCWAIIYQVDVRFRREHIERMRRREEEKQESAIADGWGTEFDPLKPWGFPHKTALEERDYWHCNLETPCLMIVTGAKPQTSFFGGDAAIASQDQHLASHGVDVPLAPLGGGGGAPPPPKIKKQQ